MSDLSQLSTDELLTLLDEHARDALALANALEPLTLELKRRNEEARRDERRPKPR